MKFKTHLSAGLKGSSPFSLTMRSLEADSGRRSHWVLLAAVLVLSAWVAWFFLARLERYEVTELARLEIDKAIYPIQAPVAGRVVSSRMVLDQEVQAGDVLVEIETNLQRLQLGEERARLTAVSPQIAARRREVVSVEQALGDEQQTTKVSLEQAQAQFREGEAMARFAEQEAGRLKRLQAQGLIPERDFMQGMAEAERRRAAAENLRLAAERLEREQKTRESDREAQLNRLRGEIKRLEGEQVTRTATIQLLEYEIERRRIQAPVAGRLGEIIILRAGAFVDEGEKLGALVPSGRLRVVAEYLPPAAMGRVRPGQPGRLRLQGYPWTQYGSIRTTVTSVASEVRDGHVRVELAVELEPGSAIPMQHGLPGTLEIQVERISPATLVLRAAGQMVAEPRSVFVAADR
jgi:multidrug resistance efflux pump